MQTSLFQEVVQMKVFEKCFLFYQNKYFYKVSIKFVVQNLKNQLVTIGRLKNYFRNNLVFQGDMFEQLWMKPNEKVEPKPQNPANSASEEVSFNKQLIFETDEIEKNLLKNAFKLVTSTFKIKGYQ